jgi:hypothetical protein
MWTAKRGLAVGSFKGLHGLLVLGLLCGLAITLQAVLPDPGGGSHAWLSSWSFGETNTWHSDLSYAPLSFTNIYGSPLGATRLCEREGYLLQRLGGRCSGLTIISTPLV